MPGGVTRYPDCFRSSCSSQFKVKREKVTETCSHFSCPEIQQNTTPLLVTRSPSRQKACTTTPELSYLPKSRFEDQRCINELLKHLNPIFLTAGKRESPGGITEQNSVRLVFGLTMHKSWHERSVRSGRRIPIFHLIWSEDNGRELRWLIHAERAICWSGSNTTNNSACEAAIKTTEEICWEKSWTTLGPCNAWTRSLSLASHRQNAQSQVQQGRKNGPD